MSTLFGLSRNPEKYEQRALAYEQKGKTNKAIKNREKAAKLRAHAAQTTGVPMTTTTTTAVPVVAAPLGVRRTPATYEQNALKWEQRGNWTKAQKNREKVWRLNNPQHINTAAPVFYQNNKFVGYNVLSTGTATVGSVGTVHTHTNAPIVETHVRATIVEQTVRPEKIVEVQPIVHREIDAPQVRVIEKHLYETVPSTGPSLITKTAIVEETVKPRIIEEVQPVVHREVPAPYIEKVEQHVTEHIVRPTVQTKEVISGTPVVAVAGTPAHNANQPGLIQKVENALHHNNNKAL